jgi:hypothetical protein
MNTDLTPEKSRGEPRQMKRNDRDTNAKTADDIDETGRGRDEHEKDRWMTKIILIENERVEDIADETRNDEESADVECEFPDRSERRRLRSVSPHTV